MPFAGLAMLLWGPWSFAGEPAYYECTIQGALPGSQDVILVVGVADGQVRQCALELPGRPYAVCRMKEHRLKADGGRLSGPMRIQVDGATEKIELDVALDKGGTYSVTQGSRKVEGNVKAHAPASEGKQWTVWLDAAMGASAPLALLLNVDRTAKTFTAEPARGYNKARHPVDASKLAFDGTNLEGEIAITITSDGWLPRDKQPIPGSIRLRASLDGKNKAGNYSAVFGVEKQRAGQVSVKPGTREQLRDIVAPVLSLQAPWRAFLVLADTVHRKDGQLHFQSRGRASGPFDPAKVDPARYRQSPLPPAEWVRADLDDSCWPRYQTDLVEFMGNCRVERGALPPALLCLRTCFGVADPGRVRDLRLKMTYLGGAVVYVNGQEVGRRHMPPGQTTPWTPAEDYPVEAYTTDDGTTPLPLVRVAPEAKWASRYAKRIRTMALDVPSRVLVKGRNVIAIALHRAAVAGPMPSTGWSHVGFRQAMLSSVSGEGVVAYDDALKGTRVWSAASVEQVAETLSPRSLYPPHAWGGNRVSPVKGVHFANPFDPVRPVKILVPRNGVCSGQAVLSDPDGLREVSAAIHDLRGPGGAVIPARAVQIRYAVQHGLVHYCDALMEKAPEGAKTVPVWLIVQAPRGAAPGWYVSALDLQANGKRFTVPVQLLVSPVTVPDARDFSSRISIAESPESVALEYNVKCWSDEHLKLTEKSLEMMGQVGNDVLHVPVILGRHSAYAVDWIPKSNVTKPGPSRRVPLIRWVKKDGKLAPEYSLLQKFLDVYSKHCAPPQALCLYIWDSASAKKMADVYENRRIPSRSFTPASPLMVSVWDPQTDTTTDTEVPAIGDPGGEEFWKPMLEGVRALVKRRGWSERIIMVGLGGDMRPAQETGELLRSWVPYVRWNILSHFSGDPGPKDGKLIATGGLEVGLKEYPAGGCLSLSQLERRVLHPMDFLELPTYRENNENMTPFLFRTLPMQWGAMTRLGLDYWPGKGGPRSSSWFSHTDRLTIPGPDGAVLSVRVQMLREGVQDHEIRAAIIRAYAKLPDEQQKPFRTLMQEFAVRVAWGSRYLSQMELSYDWQGYVARLHAAAAELTGAKPDARWEQPPYDRAGRSLER